MTTRLCRYCIIVYDNEMKQNIFLKIIKYLGSFFLIYKIRNFVRNTFFKPIFYDVFVQQDKGCVCVIAPYYSLMAFKRSSCIFLINGKRVSIQPVIIDDPEKNCLVVSYKTNLLLDVNFTYLIKRGKFEIFKGSHVTIEERIKHKLSISTLFKYEVDFLSEWIEFHLKKGVEHFYLYENNVTPDKRIASVLLPYIEKKIVTHIMWPYPYHLYNYRFRKFWPYDAYSYNQLPQINHSIYKYGGETEWMINCDVDEYFYSPKGVDFSEIISDAKGESVASIRISGFWFGATKIDVEKVKVNGVVNTFLFSEKESSSAPKCIFNTDLVQLASVHNAVKFLGKELNIDSNILRFNHYRGLGWKKRIDYDFAREIENKDIIRSRVPL